MGFFHVLFSDNKRPNLASFCCPLKISAKIRLKRKHVFLVKVGVGDVLFFAISQMLHY